MKISVIVLSTMLVFKQGAVAQSANKIINEQEVTRIESTLAADEMQGRKPFTEGIEKAAKFLSTEFGKAKLLSLPGNSSYLQSFAVITPKLLSVTGTFNGAPVDENNCLSLSAAKELSIASASNFKLQHIGKSANLIKEIRASIDNNENKIYLIDKSHEATFKRLKRFVGSPFLSHKTAQKLFILTTDSVVKDISIVAKQELKVDTLRNIVGYLPGKNKPEEFVIFSGHYDHLGVKANSNKTDSIYNGANDDAAGTTAVVMLAKYFSTLNTQGRSIIFAAFTAEESGGYGSKYFSEQLDPKKVVAMFNIEMIGTESKWGANSAYITGFDKSSMGIILQQNLAGSNFKFEADPYPAENLFYRSDNATLAALGVPAHTISTAKMDKEPFYHSADDEIETLNMANMTEIIKAIALSSASIISGKDTPTRVAVLGE